MSQSSAWVGLVLVRVVRGEVVPGRGVLGRLRVLVLGDFVARRVGRSCASDFALGIVVEGWRVVFWWVGGAAV